MVSTNDIWKICSSKWVHLPQVSGWKFQKYLSCHHLFFLPHENNVEKLRQIPRASQKNLRKFGSLGRYAAFEGSRYQSSGSLFGCLGNCVPNSSFEISLDKALKSCKILESGRIIAIFFQSQKTLKKTPPIWRCPCNLMAIYLWIGLSIGWGRLRILIQRRVSDSAPSSH